MRMQETSKGMDFIFRINGFSGPGNSLPFRNSGLYDGCNCSYSHLLSVHLTSVPDASQVVNVQRGPPTNWPLPFHHFEFPR